MPEDERLADILSVVIDGKAAKLGDIQGRDIEPHRETGNRGPAMTEAEWLSCSDPLPMLEWLRSSGRASDRKLRLFPVACVRSGLFRFGKGLDIGLEVLERYADGEADGSEVDRVFQSFGPSWSIWDFTQAFKDRPYAFAVNESRSRSHEAALAALLGRDISRPAADGGGLPSHLAAKAALLRDLFGNPFRPPPTVEVAWLSWDGGTVLRMARAIDEERAFDRMPILADALEEAGCTDEGLLQHCRGPGPHVLGCWALDAVLGKGVTP
jgi:hypothetical protein